MAVVREEPQVFGPLFCDCDRAGLCQWTDISGEPCKEEQIQSLSSESGEQVTKLNENLQTANGKITDLEAKITELQGQVSGLDVTSEVLEVTSVAAPPGSVAAPPGSCVAVAAASLSPC